MKRALITGALGQDGSYLTEHLLSLGYRVYGLIRKAPFFNASVRDLPDDVLANVEWIYGDIRDEMSLRNAIRKAWPDEIYNFAGQVYVPLSWELPEGTMDTNIGGLARILKIVEAIKRDVRIYQSSSSEMFGNHEGACNDETPLNPTSPYGISKMAAHRLGRLYRERGLYVVCGILFNHESPRRGHEMVTRKIASYVANWAAGGKSALSLGSTDSRRDWGFAGEYVKAMHLMLQQDKPDDYVVGTGVSHSVEEFLMCACRYAGLRGPFAVTTDPRLTRTQEIFDMRADNTKIREVLHWEPEVDFETLVGMMVSAEMKKLGLNNKAYEAVT